MDSATNPWPAVVRLQPGDAGYPAGLSDWYGDKAPVLHFLGNLDILDRAAIGFCGARRASEKGLATAEECAAEAVGHDLVVIAGNAAGVDLAAHRTALAKGGSTILVLPEGIQRFRIRENLEDVWDWSRVLVVSQFPPEASWQVFRAMARNELIIALSGAMIVIEAGAKGGTISAGFSALKRGTPLFVADYAQMHDFAPGNVELLKKGARALRRSRSTGRANLTPVIATMRGAPSFVGAAKQISFL